MDMYRSYAETARQALDAESAGEEYEEQDPSEFLNDWALSVDTKVLVTVWLTLGGPNVYIDCECSKDNYGQLGIDRATFVAAWGSDRKETRLDSSDALYAVAERYIEGMEA